MSLVAVSLEASFTSHNCQGLIVNVSKTKNQICYIPKLQRKLSKSKKRQGTACTKLPMSCATPRSIRPRSPGGKLMPTRIQLDWDISNKLNIRVGVVKLSIFLPYPSTSSPCKEEHPRVQIQMALIIIYVKSTWIIIQTTRQTMCSRSTKPSITWLRMWGFLTSFQEGIPRSQSWKCSSSKGLHHLSGMKRARSVAFEMKHLKVLLESSTVTKKIITWKINTIYKSIRFYY